MTKPEKHTRQAEAAEDGAGGSASSGGLFSNPSKILTLAMGTIAAGGAIALIYLMTQARPTPEVLTPWQSARKALDACDWETAKAWAEVLLGQSKASIEQRAQAAFVFGAVAAYEAREAPPRKRRSLYLTAARHLEESMLAGFPPEREAEGLLLLGQSLVSLEHWGQARPVLLEALAQNPDHQAEIHWLLSQAFVREPSPDLNEALKHNEAYLASEPLDEQRRRTALLQKAEILMLKGDLDRAEAIVAKLLENDETSPGALLIKGRLLMARAGGLQTPQPETDANAQARSRRSELLNEAIKTLQAAAGNDLPGGHWAAAAMYLIGECFSALGDRRAAETQFARTAKLHPDTDEAWAAEFRLLVAAWHDRKDDEARVLLERLGKAIAGDDDYQNRWIGRDELLRTMLERFDSCLASGDFSQAVSLVRMAAPLVGAARAGRMEAETLEAWARRLAADAEKQSSRDADEKLHSEARAKFREAGAAYEKLAALAITSREYPSYLFSAAENDFAGRDYSGAVRLSRLYMQNEVRRRHPQALVMLGESLLALGRIEEAREAFDECIEFYSRDAAVPRARLGAAQACIEQNRPDQAEKYLADNLESDVLTPASIEWRDSLFARAMLAHTSGAAERAVNLLREALTRYPTAPQAPAARYALADTLARRARDKMTSAAQSAEAGARLVLPKAVEDDLRAALALYRQVQGELQAEQQQGRATPAQRAMLRNTYFAIGAVLSDLGEEEAAIRALASAAVRHQHQPAAMNAYAQLISLYLRSGRVAEAAQAIAQARQVLERIASDEGFVASTPFTRSQWSEVLDEFERL